MEKRTDIVGLSEIVTKQKPRLILKKEFIENFKFQVLVPFHDTGNPRVDRAMIQNQGGIGIIVVYPVDLMVLWKEQSKIASQGSVHGQNGTVIQHVHSLGLSKISGSIDFRVNVEISTSFKDSGAVDQIFKHAPAHQLALGRPCRMILLGIITTEPMLTG
jgi:hypothetical protein